MFPHEYKRALEESQAVSNANQQEAKDKAAVNLKGVDAFEELKRLAVAKGGFSADTPPPALSMPAESVSPEVCQ